MLKASDCRISPFELESVLIAHEAVAEAAIVGAGPGPARRPQGVRGLAAGHEPNAETARAILGYVREHLAPYQRVQRIEFTELPKTISGKIRRGELRTAEETRAGRSTGEFRDSDFDW